MDLTTRANPYRHSFLKATGAYSNLDQWFSLGQMAPGAYGDAYQAMKARPGTSHPWIYAAISTIVESYVQCPLALKRKGDKKGADLITDHPILDLLKSPNPHMSGTNFLECIVWCLDLATRRTPGGQCFIWGDGANFRKGQIPGELWLQNDQNVRPVLNDQKILSAWRFDYDADCSPYDYGQNMVMDLQEVIRVNYFNPYKNLLGVAPGYAIRSGIDMDADAQELNSAMIRNGGQARGVYTAKKPLTPDQMNDFKANLAKYNAGKENAGKDRFLPWEMEYNQLTITPEDMQYLESMGWNRDTVMAAFKVSKFALQQYEDINYATAKEAKRQLFDQAILPMHNRIMQELNQAWIQYIGKGDLLLTVDLSGVTALQDDLDARWKRAQIAVDMGIPPVIALKMHGIDTEDLKAFKWLMENQSASAALAGPVDANGEPKKPAKPAEPKPPGKAYRFKMLTAEEKRTLCDGYITKVLDPGEAPLNMTLRHFIAKQRNRNLDLVDAWASKHTKAEGDNLPQVEDFMLDAKRENLLWAAAMHPHYDSQAQRAKGHAQIMVDRIRESVVQIDVQESVQAFLTRRLKWASEETNRTTFRGVEAALAETIAKAINAELSNEDTAKAIRESMKEVYGGRERDTIRIARTETGVVSGYVQHAVGQAAGMERHAWLATDDEKTRPTHEHADAEGPIPFNQKFSNGLDHPGDPTAPAKEVILCRCTELFLGPE